MAVNPSAANSIPSSATGSASVIASGSVLVTASGSDPVTVSGSDPIAASSFVSVSASGFVPSSAFGSVLSSVFGSGGSFADDAGVLPSSSKPEFFDIFCLPLNADGKFVVKESRWSSNAFRDTASKNDTTSIASILLSPAPPNLPPIPTVKIVKRGETGNTARNATIASMRRKPRSSKDWAAFEDAEDYVIAIHSWSSFVNAEVLKVYDASSPLSVCFLQLLGDCNKASSNMEVRYDSKFDSPANMYSFVVVDRLHMISS
ncbi:hypothetical protein SLEP1_g2980 [Rubroshorea leprosula]|uniref:Uncharacterized protein n=1 Tax=Rubroshorea leprosula TaxID=152421 RepID=A0AAV5HQD6_9ROSI|nr:hypothetical protein SLEP1_g2980 [Rubroshorea leprosula]